MDKRSIDIGSHYAAFMDAVWINLRTEEMDRYFSPSAEIIGVIANTTMNIQECAEAVEQISLLAKVRSFELVDVVDTGAGKAAILLNVWVEAVATGKEGMQEASVFLNYADGKITRSTTIMDNLGFIERAGLLPEGAMMAFLTGENPYT